ncbi:class I SAM-dependent methyltransferase [Panacibacter sp. DH6]|uniref:Class I SAM-dependent methyltransferase n=1 Tax=Panacibacter microcysteis TaxID=2793269 RepID=A0A931GV04_9BACT|nr:class I SAM-dependent methyltransferase [Panacibacter microcysteis]MBG9377261.1 class I SAM-dependent methyltransferase [Panacibacter microcysteis]
MNVQDAYDHWASQYDSNDNKTRDLEAVSLRETLGGIAFERCLEIGCGTGKNTAWLVTKASEIVAADLSAAMLLKAKEKISSSNVTFIQADITKPWTFTNKQFDLIGFSLILEHIEELGHIFKEVRRHLKHGGHLYISELHPFKQYTGSKARFETADGVQVVNCYNHNISDFTSLAVQNNLAIVTINEYFDNNDRTTLPRLFTMLCKAV